MESESCGACNLCCKLLGVPDIGKPPQMTCWWTSVHGGCQRHADKVSDPALMACAQFECVWLASQKTEGRLPKYLRPDLCHVVLGPQDPRVDKYLYVQVDPAFAQAWQQPGVLEYLRGAKDRGWTLELVIGEDHFMFDENG